MDIVFIGATFLISEINTNVTFIQAKTNCVNHTAEDVIWEAVGCCKYFGEPINFKAQVFESLLKG